MPDDAALASDLLPLPNVFAAGAPDRIGRLLFSQLLFAHRTGFGHYIRHSRDLSDQGSLRNKHVAYQKT